MYKAESFDIMQYFYGAVHNPLIHCYIRFSGHINVSELKRAVTLSRKAIPLIQCCFDVTGRRPCWKDKEFTGEDIVHVIQSNPNDIEQINRLLASKTNIMKEPQLNIYLMNGQKADSLCIIINHMICDAVGFKEYLYLLSNIYTKLNENPSYMPNLKPNLRSTRQLFFNMGLRQKLGILFSKYDLSKQKKQARICLDGDRSNPLFITHCIEKHELFLIKTYAKSQHASFNDMILTAYCRLLSRKTRTDRIVIPCPVDLRKYLRNNQKHGICNLTSNFICDVVIKEGDSFQNTLSQVSAQMNQQKNSSNCLKPIIMLELAFHLLSYQKMQKIFGKIFTIPVISYTNIGIIDSKLLKFANADILDVFVTGAIKYVPYFQVAVSTYEERCTLSCNLYGTTKDMVWIKSFLEELSKELLSV